jgi:hypothetical protein
MAKTVAGIKIQTKAPKIRTTLGADEKYTGTEPVWSGEELGDIYLRKLRSQMFYCNYHFTIKDLKKDVLLQCKTLGFTAPELRDLTDSYDKKRKVSTPTAAALCRAANRGAPMTEPHLEVIKRDFRKVISDFKENTLLEDVVAMPSKMLGIQDRITAKLSEHIAHFEGVYDEVIMGRTVMPDAYAYLVANTVPAMMATKLAKWFDRRVDELTEASQPGAEAQIKEAYRHFKAADFKRHLAFFRKLNEECDQHSAVKKTTRKARIKKAPTADKIVGKLKFMRDDKLLKLVSINPVEILKATELWIYNTRSRKLGRYVASTYDKTLSIKGTSITGFDESLSVCKTLRKPAEQLRDFIKANKTQTRKFLDSVRAVDSRMNGRINEEILLLRVLN